MKFFGLIIALGLTASTAAGQTASPDSIPSRRLEEVTVTGNSARQRISGARIGVERLELARLLKMPSFGGENDIIKSLSLLPGVRSEGDGGGGFEVRGGNSSQNLVLLDGISLYNPSHVMGIFSTFNDDALGGATLYKGPFPAMFGGASSAVLETSLAPGDMETWHASATLGLLAAKVKAEGPIVKEKLSVAVTARRSYVDAFLKIVPKYRSTVMNFYDVSAKLRFQPVAGHTLDGSFFMSRDNMAISSLMGMYWGNLGASLNWLARSGRLTFTTSAAMTRYTPDLEMNIMDMDQSMWTYIHNYNLQEKMRWEIADGHSVDFGLRSELMRVKSAEWKLNDASEREVRSLWENSAWVDYTGAFGEHFELTAGVRLNVASALGGRRFHEFESIYSDVANNFDSKTYVFAEPRVNLKYALTKLHSLKAGAGSSSQNLHAVRANSISLPFDRFALTSASVRPERAWHYAAGYNGMTESGDFDWSAELYYRSISNVYDFRDGKSLFSDIVLDNIILGGRGRSYGAEFMVRKNSGRLTGWVAYTISRTESKIPGINGDRWYDASNNRLHDFSVSAIYRITDRWTVSGSWIFLSGQPLTAPDVKYEIGGETCYYYSKRNAYKTPPTHRLDLSATYERRHRRFTSEWAFGIYNVYCRYNPYVVYFRDDPTKPSGSQAVLQAMYGLVPSVSYTIKF